MATKSETIDISYYLKLVLKYRWLLIIPFCLALSAGIYVAIISPEIYEANTLILVEPQRVPSSFVKSIVTQNIESRIGTISQQILSRTNLEKIMDEFHMFSGPEHESVFMEDKLKNLRTRINIQVSRVRAGNDTFSISFKGSDPQMTMKVTNALASYFIDENLKVRESHATGTNVFLEQELKSMRVRLQRIEAAYNDYRMKHMGELPEQLDSNLSILGRMQEQLTEKQKNLRETRAMLASLKQQEINMPTFQIDESFLIEDDSVGFESEDSLKLEQLKEELSNLRLKYTDRHPDVVRLKKTIAQLEKQIEEESQEENEELAADSLESEMASELPEIGFQDLQKVQRDEIRRDIRQQEAEIAQLVKKIGIYQQRIENTPKREQELFSLKRDYENIKSSYDSMVKRKLEAEIAVNMEKKQKGEQFRIIDPAKLPQKPVSPDVQMLFLFSVVAGLGIGGGLIFLLDFLNNSLKKPKDIESEFGLPVLASIPRIYHRKDKVKHWVNQGLTAFSLCIAGVLTAGFGVLVLKGVDPTLQFIRNFAGI
jgi:polysaccharide chain length determinant protein (PEP-CTERM system associated)